MEQLTLEAALSGLIGGTLTFPVAQWLFNEIDAWSDGEFSWKWKRLLSFILSFGLSFLALGVADWLDISQVTPETIFVAFFSGFGTSQALHGWLASNGKNPSTS